MPAYVYNSIEMDTVYSVSEAAEKLGLDTSQIRRLLAKRQIKGKKLGRDWVVLELSYKRKRKPKTKKGGSK
jgi:excisionase family DNA binding protein